MVKNNLDNVWLKLSKLIIILFASFLILIPVGFNVAFAHNEYPIIFQNKSCYVSQHNYLRVHTYCGGIELIPISDEFDCNFDYNDAKSQNFNPPRQRIYGHGRNIDNSIVMVFFARGFSEEGMSTFLEYATGAMNFTLDFYPFNLFRAHFIVYAVLSTNLEVEIINDSHGDFSSHRLTSRTRRDVIRPIVNQFAPASRFIQVLSNSPDYHYASATIPTDQQPQAIGITSTGVYHGAYNGHGAWHGSWGTVVHEFGHSFGGLRDARCRGTELIGGFAFSRNVESPNTTRMRYSDFLAENFSDLRWYHWVGLDKRVKRNASNNTWSITGRRLGGDDRVDSNNRVNSNGAYIWVSPSDTCIMISTRRSFHALYDFGKGIEDLHFCAVSAAELIRRMELIVGFRLFETTTIGLPSNEIAITGVNVKAHGYFRIPTLIDGRQVVELRHSAFANQTDVTKYVLPERLRVIGPSAFQNNNYVEEIRLPSTLTVIGQNAFRNTNATITFDHERSIIPDFFFRLTGVTEILILRNITTVEPNAFFQANNLSYIQVANGHQQFSSRDGILYNRLGTRLIHVPHRIEGHVTLPGLLEYIPELAFLNRSGITSITLNNHLREIRFNALSGTNITTITLPNWLNYIGVNALPRTLEIVELAPFNQNFTFDDGILFNFDKTEIIHILQTVSGVVVLPEGKLTIENHLFNNGNHITEIIIPASVIYIGEIAFISLVNLQRLIVDENNQHFSSLDGD